VGYTPFRRSFVQSSKVPRQISVPYQFRQIAKSPWPGPTGLTHPPPSVPFYWSLEPVHQTSGGRRVHQPNPTQTLWGCTMITTALRCTYHRVYTVHTTNPHPMLLELHRITDVVLFYGDKLANCRCQTLERPHFSPGQTREPKKVIIQLSAGRCCTMPGICLENYPAIFSGTP
jgi:hypothetical protein